MILTGAKHEWRYEPADENLVSAIADAAGVSRLLASVLVSRGVRTSEEAVAFLAADAGRLPDAHLLPDADRVVDRIRSALESGQTVAVHGHDDADGVTAAAIMIEALGQLGASPRSYIPDRRTEGHGLNRAELDRLAAEGVGLIVTVDSCGSDTDCIAYGNELGIDTIVTDHHEIPPELPPAYAIVNPKLDYSDYPYRYLAGAGVSLRVADLLVEELFGDFGRIREGRAWWGPRWFDEAVALAAVGSIADKVPVTGDNRAIVAQGLRTLVRTERPGLIALLERSRLWGCDVDPDDVRESLGPVFGRVSDGRGGNASLDLLMEEDLDRARDLASALIAARVRWRESAQAAWRKVRSLAHGVDGDVAVVEAEIPIEVMGYATSRLAEEIGRPAVVIVRWNEQAMAEARAPAGFNLVSAFDAMAELFTGYGGHPRAAGFTIATERIAEFRERLAAYVTEHPPQRPPKTIDAEFPISGVTVEVSRELERMRPYGPGNGPPVLMARAVSADELDRARALGVRFGTPVRLPGSLADIVYRVRHSDGVAFANVVDVIGSGI